MNDDVAVRRHERRPGEHRAPEALARSGRRASPSTCQRAGERRDRHRVVRRADSAGWSRAARGRRACRPGRAPRPSCPIARWRSSLQDRPWRGRARALGTREPRAPRRRRAARCRAASARRGVDDLVVVPARRRREAPLRGEPDARRTPSCAGIRAAPRGRASRRGSPARLRSAHGTPTRSRSSSSGLPARSPSPPRRRIRSDSASSPGPQHAGGRRGGAGADQHLGEHRGPVAVSAAAGDRIDEQARLSAAVQPRRGDALGKVRHRGTRASLCGSALGTVAAVRARGRVASARGGDDHKCGDRDQRQAERGATPADRGGAGARRHLGGTAYDAPRIRCSTPTSAPPPALIGCATGRLEPLGLEAERISAIHAWRDGGDDDRAGRQLRQRALPQRRRRRAVVARRRRTDRAGVPLPRPRPLATRARSSPGPSRRGSSAARTAAAAGASSTASPGSRGTSAGSCPTRRAPARCATSTRRRARGPAARLGRGRRPADAATTAARRWTLAPVIDDEDIHHITGHPDDPDLLYAALGYASLERPRRRGSSSAASPARATAGRPGRSSRPTTRARRSSRPRGPTSCWRRPAPQVGRGGPHRRLGRRRRHLGAGRRGDRRPDARHGRAVRRRARRQRLGDLLARPAAARHAR